MKKNLLFPILFLFTLNCGYTVNIYRKNFTISKPIDKLILSYEKDVSMIANKHRVGFYVELLGDTINNTVETYFENIGISKIVEPIRFIPLNDIKELAPNIPILYLKINVLADVSDPSTVLVEANLSINNKQIKKWNMQGQVSPPSDSYYNSETELIKVSGKLLENMLSHIASDIVKQKLLHSE